LVTLSS